MTNLEPVNQTYLFGLHHYLIELIKLDKESCLPNKILLSGQKGLGKSTLAYHFINYILSKNEEYKYDIHNFVINQENHSFKTTLNKSNPNLIVLDVDQEKKFIDINQIRELLSNLQKSSFNNKPKFILIDNIEFLNVNSINALLKVIEEPSINIHFILINNNKKILPTLISRCINFKIFLTHKKNLEIAEKLIQNKLNEVINDELINYYSTPGNIFNLYKFAKDYEYDLRSINLKEFLKMIIKNNDYKKDDKIKFIIFEFIELYFNRLNFSISTKMYEKYSYFLNRISNTKKFNLDYESLFMEFEEQILKG